jgi:hypothetical protein
MDYRITNNWFMGSEPSLGILLKKYQLQNRSEFNVLEIGSYEGMSTLWFYHNLLVGRKGEIYCLDTWQGGHDNQDQNWNQSEQNFQHNIREFSDRVNVVKGTSWDGLISLQHLKNYFDLVFVDGSHLAHDVLNDLVLSWPLVKPGGFIFCDDYLWGAEHSDPCWSPKQGVDSFVQTYRSQLLPVNNLDGYVSCWIKRETPYYKPSDSPWYKS